MNDVLLDIRNIETYYGPVMAIRGVSLSVREGEIHQLREQPAQA